MKNQAQHAPDIDCETTGEHVVSSQMQQLRKLMRNTALFWYAVIYFFLVTITLLTFAQYPHLLVEPQGWAILALAIIFGLWYHIGSNWMVRGDPENYHRRMDSGELPRFHWRGVLYWASMLAIVIALSLLGSNLPSNNFTWMFWAIYGLNFAVFAFPQVLITIIPTITVIVIANGWVPSNLGSPSGILELITEIAGLTIWSFIAYLPFVLIKARFRREQVFADLERSHQELELAHARLEAAHKQLEAAGEREREIAVLRERGRLARDMHDTLGHSLVLASVKLEAALRLRSIDPARADHEIVVTQQILRDSMAELRASLANLRSPLLAQESLGEALTRAANEAGARASWDVHTDIATDIGLLDTRTYEGLLRIASEAITNAERHANARTLWLHLARETQGEGNTLVMRISDDGVGIAANCAKTNRTAMAQSAAQSAGGTVEHSSVAITTLTAPATVASPPGHYGITGMRERVTALGGKLAITPLDGTHGTTVEVRVPMPAGAE